MTNTRITDAEVFERRYPVVLREFSLRMNSGGQGQHHGGEGVIRDIEFRIPVQVSILSERRVFRPYGLAGGEDAACGMNLWVRKLRRSARAGDDQRERSREHEEEEEEEERIISLGGKNTANMKPGERIIVMTPGGGGWGRTGEKSQAEKSRSDSMAAWKKGSLAMRMAMQESA
jgi:5-oxoprolinase (ATP-hydrolysing)